MEGGENRGGLKERGREREREMEGGENRGGLKERGRERERERWREERTGED